MKSINKKRLNKIESKIGLIKKRSGAIVIYNPDYPDFQRSSIDAVCIIALPDNRMDQKMTDKIGKGFVVI